MLYIYFLLPWQYARYVKGRDISRCISRWSKLALGFVSFIMQTTMTGSSVSKKKLCLLFLFFLCRDDHHFLFIIFFFNDIRFLYLSLQMIYKLFWIAFAFKQYINTHKVQPSLSDNAHENRPVDHLHRWIFVAARKWKQSISSLHKVSSSKQKSVKKKNFSR